MFLDVENEIGGELGCDGAAVGTHDRGVKAGWSKLWRIVEVL